MSPAMTEEQLAERVVAYLESCGHDVYQEVECVSGVADIVALVGPGRELWIVECKTSWSWALLEQCLLRPCRLPQRAGGRAWALVPRPARGVAAGGTNQQRDGAAHVGRRRKGSVVNPIVLFAAGLGAPGPGRGHVTCADGSIATPHGTAAALKAEAPQRDHWLAAARSEHDDDKRLTTVKRGMHNEMRRAARKAANRRKARRGWR